jgi:hypothetical protein
LGHEVPQFHQEGLAASLDFGQVRTDLCEVSGVFLAAGVARLQGFPGGAHDVKDYEEHEQERQSVGRCVNDVVSHDRIPFMRL